MLTSLKVRERRFHHGYGCPRFRNAQVQRWGRERTRAQRYRCFGCRRTFNDLTRTAMAGTHLTEKWRAYADTMRDGLSTRRAAERIDVDHKTAWPTAKTPSAVPCVSTQGMRSRGATPAPRRDDFACRIIRERVSRRRPTGLGPRNLRRPVSHSARWCAPAGPRDPELRVMQVTSASSGTVRSHALRALSVIDPHTSPSAMTSSSLRCPVVRSHPDG